jgi:selenobiotic family peptide radical SAM maturase
MDPDQSAKAFPELIESLTTQMRLPGYLADLARLEWALDQKKTDPADPAQTVAALTANPTLTLLALAWKNLPAYMTADAADVIPRSQPSHIIIWQHPQTRELQCRDAADSDLLVLKIVVEQIDPREAARQGGVSPKQIQGLIERAVHQGILIAPASRIRRSVDPPAAQQAGLKSFLAADIFTLQWHVTQVCDLYCKHCYDRSRRDAVPLVQARAVLDDFYDFCRRMHVRGQVTFSGGNPLMYPHLAELYRAADQLGFGIAILGNPAPAAQVQELVDIARPLFFQISLEGLAAHNDYIRGDGHFERSLAFLDDLRELGVYSMVMLTLTRDNLDQVLPLAEVLKGRADAFNFNRLATVGEGAALLMPAKEDFTAFLRDYRKAAASNPSMGFKDNLFNLINRDEEKPLMGGCTGFGCGAAFNFFSLLPDGEVHACRKFPSLIGNIQDTGLYDIYHSRSAARYRAGSQACADCELNLACRGCLAIAHSRGLDIFAQKDPFCTETRF